MTNLTEERRSEEEGGRIVRRYVNGRLEAERGSGYSLGTPAITDGEYWQAIHEDHAAFLRRVA